ncbi:MAG: trk/ktr system potassium uptake protein [Desulfovibrionales bacterium]|nr:trk/ktr system potassium uptake protein [Desulfovibrionales bacterium]
MKNRLLTPFWLPVWFYALAIFAGAAVLRWAPCHRGDLSLVDALFTSVSAMCVTGLSVVDTGTSFNHLGQAVILGLIQLGGLGIMTYTTLALYLFRKRVSLSDRISVSQTLLHDPAFHLVRFILQVVAGTFCVELVGAVLLHWLNPCGFGLWSALFHSVSAFCNAGFGLYSDSLVQFKDQIGVNVVIMVLITLGGLGFAVLYELAGLPRWLAARFRAKRGEGPQPEAWLSWPSRVVLRTSAMLVIVGAAAIFLAELAGGHRQVRLGALVLESLFQSVTCRTAGFNTLDVSVMTNVSLVIMMLLMVIGGSPGSCAGGIKTTTLRVWWGFIRAQFLGRDQVRVGRFAIDSESVNKALTLLIFSFFFIGVATLLLLAAEGGVESHPLARAGLLETLFETISAFGTVGLSMGLTAGLTTGSKLVISLLMFIGRLGPVWLLTALHSWQTEPRYRLPERTLPLG